MKRRYGSSTSGGPPTTPKYPEESKTKNNNNNDKKKMLDTFPPSTPLGEENYGLEQPKIPLRNEIKQGEGKFPTPEHKEKNQHTKNQKSIPPDGYLWLTR